MVGSVGLLALSSIVVNFYATNLVKKSYLYREAMALEVPPPPLAMSETSRRTF
jgi:hypothetical protein